ncbi:MAG TPA: hypothetical protein VK454_05385, partial [Myxococcaceae bacterium]|nr:hypothetical protein [Myxococcaceae bacterium]
RACYPSRMRTTTWIAAAALLAPLAAGAQASDANAPYSLSMKVGQSIELCQTGTITCPAGSAICDDPSVVAWENGEAGLVFKGLKPGTTLCSAGTAGGQGFRRVFRVTVAADRPVTPPESPRKP